MRLNSRIAKLEATQQGNTTGYRMPDGTMRYIRCKHLLTACRDALDGRPTAAADVLRNAVASDDGHLHQLVQSLLAPPYVAPCREKEEAP
jgi:hypothetical protein